MVVEAALASTSCRCHDCRVSLESYPTRSCGPSHALITRLELPWAPAVRYEKQQLDGPRATETITVHSWTDVGHRQKSTQKRLFLIPTTTTTTNARSDPSCLSSSWLDCKYSLSLSQV